MPAALSSSAEAADSGSGLAQFGKKASDILALVSAITPGRDAVCP